VLTLVCPPVAQQASKRSSYYNILDEDEPYYLDVDPMLADWGGATNFQYMNTPRSPYGTRGTAMTSIEEADLMAEENMGYGSVDDLEEDFPEPDPEAAPRIVNGKQLFINKEIK
jgi:hypothetical protein